MKRARGLGIVLALYLAAGSLVESGTEQCHGEVTIVMREKTFRGFGEFAPEILGAPGKSVYIPRADVWGIQMQRKGGPEPGPIRQSRTWPPEKLSFDPQGLPIDNGGLPIDYRNVEKIDDEGRRTIPAGEYRYVLRYFMSEKDARSGRYPCQVFSEWLTTQETTGVVSF